jgi:hypothetical protein
MNKIQQAKIKFEELYKDILWKRHSCKADREKEVEEFSFLAAAVEVS